MSLIDQLRGSITNLLKNIITNDGIVTLLTSVIMIVFWLIIAYVMILLTRRFAKKAKKFEAKENKQAITVKRLVTNIIRALFIFWITIMILKEAGIDIMPVLAGAGVIAFAVGFGAQELIKDVISGSFLIIDKTFSLGDLVEIKGIKGFITDIGIRNTKITTWKNDVVTINNGDINMVTNFSLNASLAVVDFKVSQDFDISIIESTQFSDFLKTFRVTHETIIDMPEKAIITSLLEDGIILRITAKTENLKHGVIEVELRKALLDYFAQENISFTKPMVIEIKGNNGSN